MYGVTKQCIGIISEANNLKVPEYGRRVVDVLPNGKEVKPWVYFDSALPVFEKLVARWKADHAKKSSRELKIVKPNDSQVAYKTVGVRV